MVTYSKPSNFDQMVAQAQLGDSASLDRLIRIVEPRLQAYTQRVTLDREAGSDIVQDVLLKMIESLANLRKIESFWSWLFHIASNNVNDYYRSHNRPNVIRFSTLAPGSFDIEVYDDRDTADDLASGELNILIGDSISRLGNRLRATIRMRCFYDMSYFQIGASLGCSESTARVMFLRAKRRIRSDLRSQILNGAKMGANLQHLLSQPN